MLVNYYPPPPPPKFGPGPNQDRVRNILKTRGYTVGRHRVKLSDNVPAAGQETSSILLLLQVQLL